MNQLAAMYETLEEARKRGMTQQSGDNPTIDFPHLAEMYDRACIGNYSEAKLGRHLGWIQCAVVVADIGLTLEDMKQINLKHSGETQ